MKFKLSKSQWEQIGKTAGWTKKEDVAKKDKKTEKKTDKPKEDDKPTQK